MRTLVCRQPAAEAIVDFAENPDVRMIVMATHGYTEHQRWTHGSVAERVLGSSSVPVLLVRSPFNGSAADGAASAAVELQENFACRRILVPLDGSQVAEAAVLPAATLAKAVGAEVTLFRVSVIMMTGGIVGELSLTPEGFYEVADREAEAYLRRVARDLEALDVHAHIDLCKGPVAQSIIEYVETNRIDLVAMCTHGHGGPGRWNFGTVADRVLRSGKTPLLLVRAR